MAVQLPRERYTSPLATSAADLASGLASGSAAGARMAREIMARVEWPMFFMCFGVWFVMNTWYFRYFLGGFGILRESVVGLF